MKSLLLTTLIIFSDQLSKFLIKSYLLKYQSIEIIGNFLKFTYIENKGIAFGIDTSNYHVYITILTIISILIIIYYYFYLSSQNKFEWLPLIFIISGAIGNAIDRVFVLIPGSGYEGVIDFIDIGFWNFRWYIFNIADTSVTIGIILYLILQYKRSKSKNA